MTGNRNDLAARAREELSGMAKQGMAHPSTKPVLTAAAVGAVAGILLPVVSLPAGALAGAAYAFWRRIK